MTFDFNVNGRVIESTDIDISINELQRIISITPILPSNIIEVSEKALLQNIDFSYYPTSFKISIHNGKENISNEEAIQLLTKLIDEFRTEFEWKYISKSIIIDYTNEDLSYYDYIEAIDILNFQIEILKSTVGYVMPEANEYISQEIGIGFNEILVRADLVRNIELMNLESRVNNYLLSKDVNLLTTIYQYRVEQLELNLAKEQSIAVDLQLLIDNYEGGTSTIIIPGMSVDQQIATEPYLNQLYQKLVDAQSKIADYEQDIDYYNLRIDRLNGTDPYFIVSPAKQAEEVIIVEAGILSAADTMSKIVSDAEILLTEYNRYVSRGLIKTKITSQSENINNIIILSAAGLIVGLIGGVSLAFVFDYKAKKNMVSNTKNADTAS